MQENVMKPMYKETSQTQDISTKYLQLFTIYLQVFTIILQYIYNYFTIYLQLSENESTPSSGSSTPHTLTFVSDNASYSNKVLSGIGKYEQFGSAISVSLR